MIKINLAREFSVHTKLYKLLRSTIHTRCYNPNGRGYRNYGGKGITICDEWREDHVPFVIWARNNGYREGLQIDRIDSSKGYSPENCRFVTLLENLKTRVHVHTGTHLNRGNRNFTEGDVRIIRERLASDARPEDLAREYGVWSSVIRNIRDGKYYRWVK